jgi:hypothetical protein
MSIQGEAHNASAPARVNASAHSGHAPAAESNCPECARLRARIAALELLVSDLDPSGSRRYGLTFYGDPFHGETA